MKRHVRTVLSSVLILGSLLLVPSREQAKAQSATRPNILWISIEDASPDLGCYGDDYARTPNVDRLAAEGMRYTNAFSTAPVCAPSRSAIITGMYATTIGSMHMRSKAVPPAYVRAFPEYLRAAGYYCTNNAKTDYNFEPPPDNRPPVTIWDESSARAHWRNRRDRNQPFFAVFNIGVTHESQIRVDQATYARNTARLTADQRHDPVKAKLPPYYPDTPLVRKDWATYYDNLSAMDYQVADLLKQLEDDGLDKNTVVFFWSDHGRGLPRGKRFLYSAGLRVPLIIRWPGQIKPGTVNDDLVSLFDLGPTALSLAGLPVPSHMQAQTILGNQKKEPRQYAFAHRDRMDEAADTIRSVFDKRYHYIRNFLPGRPYAQYIDYMELMPTMREWRRLYKDHYNALGDGYGKALNATQLLFMSPEKPPEELYDVMSDPHEVNNLAGVPRYRDSLARMRAALDQWQRETNDLGLLAESELRERMRPGGVWQKVATPIVNTVGAGGSVKVKLSCPTEGASIAYTTETGPTSRWLLYSGELTFATPVTLSVKACRLGYLDSDLVKWK